MLDKCKKCKYCKKDMDAWTYMPFTYCSLGIMPEEEKNCKHDKDEYTCKDYFSETGFAWALVFIGLMLYVMYKISQS